MMRILWMTFFSLSLLFSQSIRLPENFTAEFTQKITNPKNKVLSYDGTLRYSDKVRLKWAYKSPSQKEVCVDGHEMILVDHDLEQVTYLRIEDEFDFLTILKGAKHHHDRVYVSQYKDQRYTIRVDAKGQIESVAYFDNLDNKVQIVFMHIQYGKGTLPSKSMSCDIPKDFDTIQ